MAFLTATFTGVGNMSRDPKLTYSASGLAICKFGIGIGKSKKNPDTGKYEDDGVSWYNVTCFGQLGENVAESLAKGNRVLVHGKLEIDEYEAKDGSGMRQSAAVVADEVCPSLAWATVQINRNERSDKSHGTRQAASANPFAQ